MLRTPIKSLAPLSMLLLTACGQPKVLTSDAILVAPSYDHSDFVCSAAPALPEHGATLGEWRANYAQLRAAFWDCRGALAGLEYVITPPKTQR